MNKFLLYSLLFILSPTISADEEDALDTIYTNNRECKAFVKKTIKSYDPPTFLGTCENGIAHGNGKITYYKRFKNQSYKLVYEGHFSKGFLNGKVTIKNDYDERGYYATATYKQGVREGLYTRFIGGTKVKSRLYESGKVIYDSSDTGKNTVIAAINPDNNNNNDELERLQEELEEARYDERRERRRAERRQRAKESAAQWDRAVKGLSSGGSSSSRNSDFEPSSRVGNLERELEILRESLTGSRRSNSPDSSNTTSSASSSYGTSQNNSSPKSYVGQIGANSNCSGTRNVYYNDTYIGEAQMGAGRTELNVPSSIVTKLDTHAACHKNLDRLKVVDRSTGKSKTHFAGGTANCTKSQSLKAQNKVLVFSVSGCVANGVN